MPKTIVFQGKTKAGKDTCADILKRLYPEKEFEKIAFAGPLKQIYCAVKGITLEELEADKEAHRPNLILCGQFARALDPLVWVKRVPHTAFHSNILITDCRFKNEHFNLKTSKFITDMVTVRVLASDDVRIARGANPAVFSDPSEVDLDDLDPDQVDFTIVNNDSMEYLENQLKEFSRAFLV